MNNKVLGLLLGSTSAIHFDFGSFGSDEEFLSNQMVQYDAFKSGLPDLQKELVQI